MTMESPVARESVFVLNNGQFAVRRGDHQVQELLSGQLRSYNSADIAAAVSDYELNQLIAVKRIERYTDAQVWLGDLPKTGNLAKQVNYSGPVRQRTFYLNTSLPRRRMEEVQKRLQALEPEANFVVRQRGDLVAILGKHGAAFPALKDAERTQKYLKAKMPELFHETAIAFYETSEPEAGTRLQPGAEAKAIEPVAASDLWVTRGKRALILMRDALERQALHDVLCDLDMVVIVADSGVKGLQLMEDMELDLLLTDVVLPDMHGWELLAKLKEIGSFQAMPKIVLADYQSKSDDQAFALTVGKVDLYLPRPISLVLLRRNVWMTLKHNID